MITDPPRARWSFFDPVKYEAKRAELVEWRDTPGLDGPTFAHVQERIDCLDESAAPDDYLGVDPFR
jgi:hypothetical protein